MTHPHVTSADIASHGDHLDAAKVSRVKSVALGIAGIGTLLSVYGLFFAPPRLSGPYAYSWLFAFYFYLSLSLGGCFWTLLHNVTNSGWGTSVRRIFENLGSTYPWMCLFGLPLLCPQVQQYLYEWMNIHREAQGTVKDYLNHQASLLCHKYGFMNIPFWYARVILWGVGLSVVIHGLRKLSTDQDTDPNPGTGRLLKARFHSSYTLIIFALTITFTGFDFLMGLDYRWFSTMWGVYLFAGAALNSMAVSILVCAWLKRQGHLRHVTGPEHFHLMGKLLLAFTIFWAYIAFSQFFLIWYSNQTEESSYFLIRNTGDWNTAMIALVLGHFVIPFVVLLQAWLKKNTKALSIVAAYTLCMHVLDHYLITIPERGISLGGEHMSKGAAFEGLGPIQVSIPDAYWGDIFAFITLGAAFVFFLLRALGQHSLYPNRDPRILESANVSN
ncbi:MAG: hypothetical protein WCO57_08455 [Verrucomicrobiota bacterium]